MLFFIMQRYKIFCHFPNFLLTIFTLFQPFFRSLFAFCCHLPPIYHHHQSISHSGFQRIWWQVAAKKQKIIYVISAHLGEIEKLVQR